MQDKVGGWEGKRMKKDNRVCERRGKGGGQSGNAVV